MLSLSSAQGQHSPSLRGETSGTQGGFDIVESEREVGQKHFFPGLETSINIRWRGSTFLVCKGESCGGKNVKRRAREDFEFRQEPKPPLLPLSGAHHTDINSASRSDLPPLWHNSSASKGALPGLVLGDFPPSIMNISTEPSQRVKD